MIQLGQHGSQGIHGRVRSLQPEEGCIEQDPAKDRSLHRSGLEPSAEARPVAATGMVTHMFSQVLPESQ